MARHHPHQPNTQHAAITLRFGKRSRVRAELTMTPAGLLSVGALVSSILLSTAVIVRTARRPAGVPPALPDEGETIERLR
ncbi:hypothetical protein [Sphingomonas sp. RIT328]|uniref:hypothetical protein n=1 Tax=Sphingomonas sp. RIT328 TaxID=1470591 RepID=UPI00044D9533|nr:hypothetical protein [Sphingomonas sp. RIT328]EZP53505.1 hypothetical protein BW41_01907 [Sphingomonas sp. RIT328]